MEKFTIDLKPPINDWNLLNPTLKQKNLTILASETKTDKSQLSRIGKVNYKSLETHLYVIFESDDKEIIKANWEHYKKLNIIAINKL